MGGHDAGLARSVRADHRLGRHGHRGPAVPAALRPRHQPRARPDRLDRHRVLGAVRADLPARAARAVRARGVLAVHPEAAAWRRIPDDLTQPVKGFWPRQARFVARHARAGVDRLHVVLLVGAVGVCCSSRRTACRRATSCSAHPRRATARRCSPSTSRRVRAVPVYVIVPEEDVADAVEVLDATATASSRWPWHPRTRRPGRRPSRSRTASRSTRVAGPPGAARARRRRSRTATCC